jgi:hypothetical protein
LFTARQVYTMLENESLWDAANHCHQLLAAAHIPHAVMGGVAVCLHGYQRNTVDLDLLIRTRDFDRLRATLEHEGYVWNAKSAEFRTASGIAIQLLMAGERAGPDSEARLPDPDDKRTWTEIEGLPVVTLARLIESKIACGQGNLRRTHKDYADVVELIAQHRLNSSFARFLHKSLRPAFRQLVQTARGKG